MDRSIYLYVLRDACHKLFCVFKDFYASGTQDAEVTKSLHQKKVPAKISSGRIYSRVDIITVKAVVG